MDSATVDSGSPIALRKEKANHMQNDRRFAAAGPLPPVDTRLERWVRHALRPASPALVLVSADVDGATSQGPTRTVIEVCNDTRVLWRHILRKPPEQVSWADVIHVANLWDRERHQRHQ